MSKRSQLFVCISLLVIATAVIVSCQQDEQPGVTAPGAAIALANFWGNRSAIQDVQVYVGKDGQDLLSVNVPAAGGYRLAYDVVKAGTDAAARFYIDFGATSAAVLCVGLEAGDVLERATLYPADFTGLTPLLVQGALRMFGFPGGWHGWDGPVPPPSVTPVSVNAEGTLLYADSAAQVTTMDNQCKVLPPELGGGGSGGCKGFEYDGHCWVKCVGNESITCSDACVALGGTFDEGILGYFTDMDDNVERTDACNAILNGIKAGGTGEPSHTSGTSVSDRCNAVEGNRRVFCRLEPPGGWSAMSMCEGDDACACVFE